MNSKKFSVTDLASRHSKELPAHQYFCTLHRDIVKRYCYNINSRSHILSPIRCSIPDDLMCSGALIIAAQLSEQAAADIIHFDVDIRFIL